MRLQLMRLAPVARPASNSPTEPHMPGNVKAHFGRGELPISDYHTDTKTVLDGSLRFMQARIPSPALPPACPLCTRRVRP